MSEAAPESPEPTASGAEPPKSAENAADVAAEGPANAPAASGPAKTGDDEPGPAAEDEPGDEKPGDDAPASKFTGTAPPAKPKKKRKWLKRIGIAFAMIPVLMLALWIAIHHIDGFGPWLANLGRAIVGDDAIAKLEDWAYGVQDKVNLATRSGEKPKPAWSVTPRPEKPKTPEAVDQQKYPDFDPKDVGPVDASFAAPGDGQWVPMPDERFPDEPAPMMKTLLHPDRKRGWAQVAVVAIDLRQVELHIVAGTIEPITTLPEAKAKKRSGVIPESDLAMALAAFNGGFMATHGHYGMKSDGVTWIAPKAKSCTIAFIPDQGIAIRSWEELSDREGDMPWFRQTPMCMVENGKLHPGLALDDNTYWGATLDKETIIRRSAMGISEDGQTLFVGIGEATSAGAIAKGLEFAGAYHVAQLDVNFSYPKFVTISPHPGGPNDLELKPLVDTFKFSPDDYIKRPAPRDFFYLTRLAEPKKSSATPSPAPAPAPSPSE
jgi:hypothetical protein